MKWASKHILEGGSKDEMDRAMWFYYSAQKGDLKSAYNDIHRAGFTSQSIKELLSQLSTLEDVKVYTTEGNFGNWDSPENLRDDDLGYNIMAIATKRKHDAPISLRLPIAMQEEAKSLIGEKAINVTGEIKKVAKDRGNKSKHEKKKPKKKK